MTDRVYLLVSSFCVVEAIELLKKEGCVELGLSKQDNFWLLSFNLPIKKSSVDDLLTENCSVEKPEEYFLPKNERHDAPCTPQMIAEADCEGDIAKCGGICYAKSKRSNR